MKKTGNIILEAVLSKLISERDEILAKLHLILNESKFESQVSDIIETTTNLFKKLSQVENSIESVSLVIEGNSKDESNRSKNVEEINDLIKKLQNNNTQNNTQNDGNNS